LNIVLHLETVLENPMKNTLLALTAVVFILSACSPAANEPGMDKPIATTNPDDSNLMRGNVYLDSTQLLTMESYPLQFTLALKGNLPTPCNQLRVSTSPPDSVNKIVVDVYSVLSADTMCAQVLEPFEENVPLGSFPAGHYTLWVNGQKAAEFDA
jgi:hypothetical protein